MNCQEFDKHIQAFIERDMDYSRLDEFIAHYRSCEDCHEELEINFLMAYVLKDDSQTSFNLSKKLECHIQEELNKKKRFCSRFQTHVPLPYIQWPGLPRNWRIR